MPINMRSRLICPALLILAGCDRGASPPIKWVVPVDLAIARSYSELTNEIALFNAGIPYTFYRVENSTFAILERRSHDSSRMFDVFVFENIENELWHLRGIQFIHNSQTMSVKVIETNGALSLIHDEVPLFTATKAAEQVLRQRFGSPSGFNNR